MTGFAYFDGEKWVENLSMNEIRALAMSGVIKETTLIRNAKGQETEARFIGLHFSRELGTRVAVADLPADDESIMQPAIAIIEVLYNCAVAGAALSGVAALIGMIMNLTSKAWRKTGYSVLSISAPLVIECIIFAVLLVVLKHFAICFGQIEKNTRQE